MAASRPFLCRGRRSHAAYSCRSCRSKQALKRGGGRDRVPLRESSVATPARDDLLALDEALTRLDEHRPDIARLVTLRYFGGLTMEQAANSLNISLRTAERNWTYARAWLLHELAQESDV